MTDDHLIHGWEPDLPADDSLLRQYVLACADRNELIAGGAGGRCARWDDVAAADPASAVLFDNAAVLLQPPAYASVTDAARRVLDFYPPERHFVLLSAWPTPDLGPLGFELMGHPPLMVRPPGGAAPALPDGLVIREVRTPGDLADFLTTIIDAYPMPEGRGSPLGGPSILDGPVRLFVGELDGRTVATAGARLGHGIVDVEWVSCRPEARRRGIGAALTWAATLTEPSLPAMLIASDDGQGVYEQMGYLRLLRLTLWHRPPVRA